MMVFLKILLGKNKNFIFRLLWFQITLGRLRRDSQGGSSVIAEERTAGVTRLTGTRSMSVEKLWQTLGVSCVVQSSNATIA